MLRRPGIAVTIYTRSQGSTRMRSPLKDGYALCLTSVAPSLSFIRALPYQIHTPPLMEV
ncbi:hypothetical protein M378DRAFT_154702 [Amanita muscaria Koide BX008]|uniref:Uncharacterized protein n=1 Tax=Amanita muscaria (strain Koide BX008) TaxID=946122 RepID=A0A0C2T5L7_AMAMK|nr:hypothetical protein M378DRAFT_154702 [Amanita muscaria Koide BX008]